MEIRNLHLTSDPVYVCVCVVPGMIVPVDCQQQNENRKSYFIMPQITFKL